MNKYEIKNLSKFFSDEYIISVEDDEINIIEELHTKDNSVFIDGENIDALLICDDHFYLVLNDGTELYLYFKNAPKTISL